MINTYLSYQLISRDVGKAIDRVEQQPLTRRETEYYLANISKIKSIDEFVADDRLFRYAMKAHGLEDMTYAKAFMVKALKEGVSDEDSFANKLTDKRYAQFVRTYNFAAFGDKAMVYSQANQATVARFTLAAIQAGVLATDPALTAQNKAYQAEIVKVASIDDFLKNDFAFSYAMKAFGLIDHLGDKTLMRDMLEGGVDDPDSLANRNKDTKFADFVRTFNFAKYGEATTTYNAAAQPAVDKYMRQTLEEDAGEKNEGVRLALYFERNAASIANGYSVLADTAMAKVVRTVLSLPDSFATADIDRQAELFESRIDFADFKDPEKLEKFLTRFTSMWEIQNPTSAEQSSLAVLFSQPVEYGISGDVMLTLQSLKLGGA